KASTLATAGPAPSRPRDPPNPSLHALRVNTSNLPSAPAHSSYTPQLRAPRPLLKEPLSRSYVEPPPLLAPLDPALTSPVTSIASDSTDDLQSISSLPLSDASLEESFHSMQRPPPTPNSSTHSFAPRPVANTQPFQRLGSVASRESSYSPPADRSGRLPPRLNEDLPNTQLIRQLEQLSTEPLVEMLLLCSSSGRTPNQEGGVKMAPDEDQSNGALVSLLNALVSGSHVLKLQAIPSSGYLPQRPKTCDVATQTDTIFPCHCTTTKSLKPMPKGCISVGTLVVMDSQIPLSRGVSLRRPRTSATQQQQQANALRFKWPSDGEFVQCVEMLPNCPIAAQLSLVEHVPRQLELCVTSTLVCGPQPTKLKRKELAQNGTQELEATSGTGSQEDSSESDPDMARKLRRQLRRTQKTQEISTALIQEALLYNNDQPPTPKGELVNGDFANNENGSRLAQARQRAKKFIEQRKLSTQEQNTALFLDINKVAVAANQREPSLQDDIDGHLLYNDGDWLMDRCTFRLHMFFKCPLSDDIHKTLGEGTFGKVVECRDHVL
ncbi:Dual specificity protein kinase clk3, partial [Cichlidogyrus casuarinus]